MNLRRWNDIFAYGHFIVGAVKIIMIILAFIQFGTNLAVISNGGDINANSNDTLYIIVGFAQIILAIGSIIMIILNIKKQPEVIIGYLWGLGAILLELIIPSFLRIYFIFVECGMYMKAGIKIKNINTGQDMGNRTSKQTIKNTEWFYGNDDK